MKIAIVGSGISGLTAAYYLNSEHHVEVFEANDYVGGHTDTHLIEDQGQQFRVDSGFIVFNENNYPNFLNLMRELGVPYQDSDMSFSVSNRISGLEYNATDLNGLFCQRRNFIRPRFYRMIFDIFRFYRESPAILEDDSFDEITLEQYLEQMNYSDAFMDDHLFPMTGALWSATPERVKQFPVKYLVSFMNNHRMLQAEGRPEWKVIRGGSQSYVSKLTAGFRDRIHLNSPVKTVHRSPNQATLTLGDGSIRQFDKVVLACHSDQALKMLANPTPQERGVLGNIEYQQNRMVLHRDERFMPKNRNAWASWNALVPRDGRDQCTVTYYMNLLQTLNSKTPFLVTLNPMESIPEEKVWQERLYDHPIYSIDTVRAQQHWQDIDGVLNTHYCGAYWGWGFHEDGVRSALNVVNHISREETQSVA